MILSDPLGTQTAECCFAGGLDYSDQTARRVEGHLSIDQCQVGGRHEHARDGDLLLRRKPEGLGLSAARRAS